MIDPKQNLTRFSQIYAAANRITNFPAPAMATATVGGGVTFRDTATAEMFAQVHALHETDAPSLAQLQQEFSISSVEEIVALARIDARENTTLLSDAGVSDDFIQRTQSALLQARPADEMSDWERYETFEYARGFDLDMNVPPPGADADLGAAALGVGPAGHVPLPVTAATPPPSPSVNLIDSFMPPIKDQGDRGTCVAFTAMACLEYHLGRFGGMASLDLSEQFAYWSMVTTNHQRNLIAMYPLLKTDGSCRETTWPYYPKIIIGNDTQQPPPSAAPGQAKAFVCRDVLQLPARSVDAIRQALSQQRVVGIGIPVYRSWFKSAVVRKHGNITVPLPGEVPDPVGHAIALVGYEDNAEFAGGGYFIVRNSWNGYWATLSVFGPGYGTIPYRYIERFNWDAWCIVS
jgi:hypothetical protein